MRALVVFAFLSILCADFASAAVRRATREEIEAAGITRLSEIFLLFDDCTAVTTDGYTWNASINALTPLQEQRWAVILDGQVFDTGTFEAINLNALPISLDQVASVTVYTTPTIIGGEFTSGGLIQITTNRPRRSELLASAYLMGGNETGDPGPYRYTDRAGSNVDAIGPDIGLALGANRGAWRATLNASVLVHYFTDPAMRRRTSDILGLADSGRSESDGGLDDLFFDNSSAAVRQASTSLHLGYRGGRSYTEGLFAYSNGRRTMQFSPVMGREVPADQRLIHAGIRGQAWRRPNSIQLHYETVFSINRLARHPGAHFDYAWKTRRSRSRIEVWAPNMSKCVGVGLDHIWAYTNDPLADHTALVVPLYGRMSWMRDGSYHVVGGMVSFAKEDKADKFYMQSHWRVHDSHWLSYAASYSERLVEENRDLWFWTGRGYGLLDSNQVDYSIDGNIGTSRMVTADVEWGWSPGQSTLKEKETTGAAVTLFYRHFDDLYLERHDYGFDETTCSFTGPTEVVTGQAGHVAGGRVRATVPVGPRTEATARYRYQRAFEGNDLFEDVWAVVPEHLASLRLTARPRPDLTAWLSVEWRSATDWADFADVDGATCTVAGETVTYHSHLDDIVTVDAKLGKRMWGGRAAFDILGRNLTGATVRYHPAGADFDLAFFAQLRVELR